MPLGRYFTFTTSLLLALLLLADRYMPKQPQEPMRAEVDRSVIRIHSGHKWPDAIVIDTSLPTITPPAALTANAPADRPPRNAFAQLPRALASVRAASSTTETRPVGSRHPVKTARPVRRVASYQAADFRNVLGPTAW